MKRLILAIATLLCLAIVPATASAAYDPLTHACGSGGGANGSSACSADGSKDPISGKNGILMKVSGVLATIGGLVAVIIIVVAGFSYITSAGDAQKANNARSAIIGAIIGLVIIAAAETIVVFVINKI